MLTTDLLTAALDALPPLQRKLVEGAFLNGERETDLMRQYSLKRSEVREMVTAGLERMRFLLQCRGVRNVTDVL